MAGVPLLFDFAAQHPVYCERLMFIDLPHGTDADEARLSLMDWVREYIQILQCEDLCDYLRVPTSGINTYYPSRSIVPSTLMCWRV